MYPATIRTAAAKLENASLQGRNVQADESFVGRGSFEQSRTRHRVFRQFTELSHDNPARGSTKTYEDAGSLDRRSPIAMNQNRFLRALPEPVRRRIASRLETVPLTRGCVLNHIGTPVGHVYFPDRGLLSLMKVTTTGQTIEFQTVGAEGFVGLSAVMGVKRAMFETTVALDGVGRRLKIEELRSDLRVAEFDALVNRYLHYVLFGLGQHMACGRFHSLQQRCCLWLLRAQDNAVASEISITHEFLALQIGAHRPTLSLALESLQHQGMISIGRASIAVLDRRALESTACECYRHLKAKEEKLYGTGSPSRDNGREAIRLNNLCSTSRNRAAKAFVGNQTDEAQADD